MARLPIPGSDDGAWGTILNEFLSVELNNDGTLKTTGSLGAKADDTAVIHTTGNETISGTKAFNSSPTVPTPTLPTQVASKSYVDSTVSAGVPDASPTTKGIVQLTGDLGGTATAPTVPGLASKADTTAVNTALAGKENVVTAGTTSQYYRGDKTWQTLPAAPVTSVNTQTGAVVLTKADVGLGNVDNTSDATKNSATATLTNKTLTSPVINNPTGFLTGAAKITVGTSTPSSPSTGDIWIDTN